MILFSFHFYLVTLKLKENSLLTKFALMSIQSTQNSVKL